MSNNKLTFLVDILKSHNLHYMYIDDNTINGTLNPNVFKNNLKGKILRKGIYSSKIFFTPNKNNIILYLIDNKDIIGYIQASFDSSNINNKISEHSDIIIDYVSINEKYRGKKLCKLMIKLFLLNANLSMNRNLSFCLYNIGGDISCKCYFDAFAYFDYSTFFYNLNKKFEVTEKKSRMNRNICNLSKDYLIMIFIKENLIHQSICEILSEI